MYVQLLELKAGDRVKLHDGSVHEIVSNPRDGIWVETRPVSQDAPPQGAPADETVMTHCQEIKDLDRPKA